MASEHRMEKFNVGDIIISRILRLEDGWYNMKLYYFTINNDEREKAAFKYFYS
jgi:hypothetical protein